MTHGEIWTIDFGIPVGSLPSKIRPAVVMQNGPCHKFCVNDNI